jgi:hypothetical protein
MPLAGGFGGRIDCLLVMKGAENEQKMGQASFSNLPRYDSINALAHISVRLFRVLACA